MNHFTPTTPPTTRTAADWDAMARAHLAAIGNGGFTPTQDYRLMEGLATGHSIPVVASAVGVSADAATARFRAMRIGVLVTYSRREIFPIEAQEALIRVLRARRN